MQAKQSWSEATECARSLCTAGVDAAADRRALKYTDAMAQVTASWHNARQEDQEDDDDGVLSTSFTSVDAEEESG